VSSYTITITPDDGSTTTTLRLDTGAGGVTLTDLHLHAPAGLSRGKLPAIDYGLLLQAIGTAAPTPVTAATPAAQPGRPGRPRGAATRTGRTATVAAPAARRTAAAAKSSTGTRTGGSGRTGGTGARARGGESAGRTAAAGKGTGRAYRRLPDDLASVYRQTSSATALADLYGVPRHTVNGWLRRLRDQGLVPATR